MATDKSVTVRTTISGIVNGEALVRIAGLDHRVPVREAVPGPAQLAVRPNAIMLSPGTGAAWPGRIKSSAYLGDHVEYEVETDVGNFFVVDHTVDRILPPAADASIQFKNRGIALIDR